MMLNRVTIFNVFSLGSAFLIPTAAAFFDKESVLIILNVYFLCTTLASIPDSFIQVRLEVFLARVSKERGSEIISKIFSRYFLIIPLVSISSIIELYLLGFSFSLVLFTRHVYNLSRNCLPQCDIYVSNSWVLNLYATIRNLSIFLSVLILNDTKICLAIYAITFCELFFLYIRVESRGLLIKKNDYSIFRVMVLNVKNIRKPYVQTGIFSGLLASTDRFIISLFFSPDAQVIYLKYKLMYQYIDGFFGVFGYQMHLNIIKTKKMVNVKVSTILLLLMTMVGMVGSTILLNIQSYWSYFVVFILVLMMSLKRMIDGVITSYLISIRKFGFIVFKSAFEMLVVSITLMTMYHLLFPNIDKVYFSYVLMTLITSSIYIFKVKKEYVCA